MDITTYGAAVGAAKKYTDEHSGGSSDAVKYTEQTLTTAQQAQARENIGAAASDDIPTDAVKYTAQSLTAAQKSRARENIGASDGDYRFLTNAPPLIKGSGTGGNLTGGTGMNNMNVTAKQNSMSYGYVADAKGNYSMAFGYYLQALHDYEIAYGKFNQSNDDTAFSIGDGTSNSDRHNLMEVKTNGQMFLNGNAVKTESNIQYPRLGQILGTYPNNGSSASTKPFYIARGIANCFNAASGVTKVTFPTGKSNSALGSRYRAFVFGDFEASRDTSDSTTVNFFLHRTFDSFSRIFVESCEDMFSSCRELTTIDNISRFDTSEVHSMDNMFNRCEALTALNLSNFDTSNVKRMFAMFYGCTALATLDISSFDMTNVTSYSSMFGATNFWAGITTLKTPKINPHDDIPLPRTLYSQDGTAYKNLPVTTGTSIELRQSWT